MGKSDISPGCCLASTAATHVYTSVCLFVLYPLQYEAVQEFGYEEHCLRGKGEVAQGHSNISKEQFCPLRVEILVSVYPVLTSHIQKGRNTYNQRRRVLQLSEGLLVTAKF